MSHYKRDKIKAFMLELVETLSFMLFVYLLICIYSI